MKKPLSPAMTVTLVVVALVLLIGGGLAYLNKPDGQLTEEEVKKIQRGARPPESPTTTPAAASNPAGSATNPASSGDGRSPGGIPGQ